MRTTSRPTTSRAMRSLLLAGALACSSSEPTKPPAEAAPAAEPAPKKTIRVIKGTPLTRAQWAAEQARQADTPEAAREAWETVLGELRMHLLEHERTAEVEALITEARLALEGAERVP